MFRKYGFGFMFNVDVVERREWGKGRVVSGVGCLLDYFFRIGFWKDE